MIIIAYSFGTVVATEVLTMLESKGRIVRAIFIDGSPDMMRDMVCNHFPSDDEALFQSLLLSNFLKEYIPHDTLKHKVSYNN